MAPTTRSTPIPSPSYYDSPPSLLNIVRRANVRYSHIASLIRESMPKARPSNAQKRAEFLHLTVNTEAARKLDQQHVSVIPLPIIEVGPSPIEAFASSTPEASLSVVIHAPQPKRPILKCVIPTHPRQEPSTSAIHLTMSTTSDCFVDSLESPLTMPSSTEDEQSSILFAPAALRGQSVPWRPVTSCWSPSTIGDSDIEMDLGFQVKGSHGTSTRDVPVRPMAPLPGARGKHTRSHAMQVDMTSGPHAMNGQSPRSRKEDSIQLHVAIGKRKTSCASDQDMASPYKDADSPVEKRPKYMRKQWARKPSAFKITYNERGQF